jgi:hypothetical protein
MDWGYGEGNLFDFNIGGPGFSGPDTQGGVDFSQYTQAPSEGPNFDLSKYLPKGMSAGQFLQAAAPFLGQLSGGALQAIAGKKNQDLAAQNWGQTLQANRPNQYTPFGSSEWTKDDKGNWVQTQKLSPEMQERLGIFNQIAKDRMTNAAGMKLPKGGIDYGALGLSNIAKAAGITEGQSPDARASQPPYNPYSDFAGGILSPYYSRGFSRGFNPIFGS